MTATALPSSSPSPASTRAARIIKAWFAWRAGRLARPKLGTVVDGAMLAALVATWIFGYVALCPREPVQHHPRPAVAQAFR